MRYPAPLVNGPWQMLQTPLDASVRIYSSAAFVSWNNENVAPGLEADHRLFNSPI
jgi:hypothetical protein